MDYSKVKKEPGIDKAKSINAKVNSNTSAAGTGKIAHHPKTPQQKSAMVKRPPMKKSTPKTPAVVKIEPNTGAPVANKVNVQKTKGLSPSRSLINKLGSPSSAFYVPVPTRPEKRGVKNVPSSVASSSFTIQQRIETAGTNFSNMSTSRDATGGDTTKLMSHINSTDGFNLEGNGNLLLGLGDISMDAQYGSDDDEEEEEGEESPTLNRKRPTPLDLDEVSKKQKIVSLFNEVKNRISIIGSDESMNSNIGVDGGSDYENMPEKVASAAVGKYQVINKPVFEAIDGENESTYLGLIGKTNGAVELNNNEWKFLEDSKLKFDEWIEKGETINREHLQLTHKAVMARMKFDKRFQLILDNLDDFAIKLEKCGDEINKRSEMLKEYCSKIINEI